MRILPSVWTFMKEPTEDVEIRGFHVPKGSQIMVCPSIVHLDQRWFDRPDEFDPDRFTPEREKAIRKGAYIPFSGGSRVCMGKAFAMMESKIILGTMLQRIDPAIPNDWTPVMVPELSMHPKDGMPFDVVLRERSSVNAA
jgi:cytochrome P450